MNINEEYDVKPTADVGAQRVAHVYAEALLNAAEKRGEADAVLDELQALVRDVFRADPQLETFLASGAIGREQKARIIQSALGGRAGEVLVNFLLVLNSHERLGLLRPVLAEARVIRDERTRRIRVHVRTAVPLPDDQAERLRAELREALRLEPDLDTQVDPELLGGLVVQVGDWLYDGSVRTQIDNIRGELIARGSYEIQSRRDRFRS